MATKNAAAIEGSGVGLAEEMQSRTTIENPVSTKNDVVMASADSPSSSDRPIRSTPATLVPSNKRRSCSPTPTCLLDAATMRPR